MASQNVEVLREIYDHWGRGDWEYLPTVYADEFEWGWSPEFPEIAGVYRDERSPNPRLQTWLSPWEHWQVEVEDYLEDGDTVIVLARYRGRGKGSGVDVDVPGAHVWRMRDGRAIRLEVFANRQTALAAVASDL
jgi:ketosteroid isomerase-like protein